MWHGVTEPTRCTGAKCIKSNKKIFIKKNSPTTVQICRLENVEHKSMKQVSYSGKYSLSASRAH